MATCHVNIFTYGSEEGIDFTNIYFYTVTYYALQASNKLAIERQPILAVLNTLRYASGEYFDKYINQQWQLKTEKVKQLFQRSAIHIPTSEDWQKLKRSIIEHGIYNQNLQTIPPTGSISYINHSTSSIHPIVARIEIRKKGKIGRVYYPAPYLTNEDLEYYQDAYQIGAEKIIDTYAAATQHINQGLSLTLFFTDEATTRDINRAQIWLNYLKMITVI